MHGNGKSSLDPQRFRAAMGHFATGVTIVTSMIDGRPVGMTVNSFTSVSLNPVLLLVCLKLGSTTGRAIRDHGSFGVNLLSNGQQDMAVGFSRSAENRFMNIDFDIVGHGVPLIRRCAAHFVCRLDGIHMAGDHDIVLGEVLDIAHDEATDPLIFVRGRFGGVA